MGVQQVLTRELDIPGLLYRLDSHRSIVVLNQDEPSGRQRFTHAHELGHILVGTGEEPQVSCRNGKQINRRLERACDVIASEILMPEVVFRQCANDFGWTLRSVRELANHFQVSVTAAALRIFELIQEPLVISAWRPVDMSMVNLKRLWLRRNELGKALKPDFRRRNGSHVFLPVLRATTDVGVQSGSSKVLLTHEGETLAQVVFTESLGVGVGRSRLVLAFHYLARNF